MEKVKIGVVGAGNISCNAHLPAYARTQLASVEVICDLDLDRAKQAAERFGIPRVCSSVTEMIKEGGIEAVDVCTWNNAHSDVAVEAAHAGLHVMCEKPLALNLSEALRIEKSVKETGVKFMLAVPNRFRPENRRARALRDAGDLGEVYFARAAYVRRRGTPLGWFTDLAHAGGGPVIDIGVHCIDAAWYIMGNPRPVSVLASTSYRIGDYKTLGVDRWHGTPCPDNQFNVEDSGAGCIRFENGAIMLFEAAWAINLPPRSEITVCGSKAGLTLDPLTVYGEKDGYLNDETLTTEGETNAIFNEIEAFCKYVRSENDSPVPISQAVTLQRMLQGIYDSAAAGREVLI